MSKAKLKIAVPKEIHTGEKCVATTPEVAKKLQQLGFSVALEAGAGEAANFTDADYQTAGVEIVDDAKLLWQSADIILKVRAPEYHAALGIHEAELLQENMTLIGFIKPAQNKSLIQVLSKKKVNVLAMDSIPRLSRAQKMDALSTLSNIAGYRAVIEASQHFSRFFTGQITAAGNVPPAKVLVIGAGVAGLAAIGIAKSMGAIVSAFDTRPEVKEQIESLGAECLTPDFEEDGTGIGGYAKTMSQQFMNAEKALLAQQAKLVDIIITTALIPGQPAPQLITENMVKTMKTGSVIVDLAAEQGGNCALTEKNNKVYKHGVTIIGYTDLPSRLATQTSQLYATNIMHLLSELTPNKNGTITFDLEDEVIRGATVIRAGKIIWPPPPLQPALLSEPRESSPPPAIIPETPKPRSPLIKQCLAITLAGLGLYGLGLVAPASFMAHFTVFVLACFVGYLVIWNVTAALHTPLMSLTNAISSIIIIGALIQVSAPTPLLAMLAGIAILITSINITGGFAVTQRMLKMFRK